MDVRIGEGIGEVYFGYSQKRLVAKLGQPDRKKREGGDTKYYYNAIHSMFQFENNHSGKLGWIEKDHPHCTLNGRKIFRMSRDPLIAFVRQEFGPEVEVTDYGFMESCFCEDIWLELQFGFGRLKTLALGVLFMDNDRVKWPELPAKD